MDEGVFELSQKIKKLQNEINNCEKKCTELQTKLPQAQLLEEKLTPLQYSEDARERGKYVDAFANRGLIEASLRSYQARLTIAKYELEKIINMQNEIYQTQPE